MKSDLGRYELDESDRKDNGIASLLTVVSWVIAIGGLLRAWYALSNGDGSAFWVTLFAAIAASALIRGVAELIRLLQAILLKIKS